MAGIGFVLRKLTKRDDLLGLIQAYTHATFVSAGPGIFTIAALLGFTYLGAHTFKFEYTLIFRIIIAYNFSFSLVFCAPVMMFVTRYMSDKIYMSDLSTVTGTLIGAVLINFIIHALIGGFYYFYIAEFKFLIALTSFFNFLILSGIWSISVFLSVLKDYKSITFGFLVGLIFSVIFSFGLSHRYELFGMITGFNLGFIYIFSVLCAKVFTEYDLPLKSPFEFLKYFRNSWEIAFGAMFYSAGLWVDKWIMWFSPEASSIQGLFYNINYDTAMFLAMFTLIPAMSFYVVTMESDYFEKHYKFFNDILKGANFDQIENNYQTIVNSIFEYIKIFVILQAVVSGTAILLAPEIFEIFNMPLTQLVIFRFGVLGCFFLILFIFFISLLTYFAHKKSVFIFYSLFLFFNGLFTWLILNFADYKYYGFGFFLSCLLIFVISGMYTIAYIKNLPYHTFITTNVSIKQK